MEDISQAEMLGFPVDDVYEHEKPVKCVFHCLNERKKIWNKGLS